MKLELQAKGATGWLLEVEAESAEELRAAVEFALARLPPDVARPAPEFTPEEVNESEEGLDLEFPTSKPWVFGGMVPPTPKPLPRSYVAALEADRAAAESEGG